MLNEVYRSLRLLLGTEAPAVTPNGIDSPFCVIDKQPHLAALLCCQVWKGAYWTLAGQGRAGQGRTQPSRKGQGRAKWDQGGARQGRAGQDGPRQGKMGSGRSEAGQGRAGQGRAGPTCSA